MKLKYVKIVLPLIILLTPLFIAWGTFGHEHINRAAVFALPQPVQTFFYNHVDFITLESTVPDLRKYTLGDKAENPRHYIDLENFGAVGDLPVTMADAKAKYDEKFLQQNGILPWYIADIMTKLTQAFKDKRKTEILFLAADLGHYIGDAHMPLHTSVNHDGQQTDQKGIHSFWESQLPELFGTTYNYNVPEAKYVDDVQKEIIKIIVHSHSLVDTLLAKDKKLSAGLSPDKLYQTDAKGVIIKSKFNQQIHTREYAKMYHDALNGMVENQMKAAVSATADFWYTAWVNAGKPDLSGLDPAALTKKNSEQYKDELSLFKSGKLFGIESEKEY